MIFALLACSLSAPLDTGAPSDTEAPPDTEAPRCPAAAEGVGTYAVWTTAHTLLGAPQWTETDPCARLPVLGDVAFHADPGGMGDVLLDGLWEGGCTWEATCQDIFLEECYQFSCTGVTGWMLSAQVAPGAGSAPAEVRATISLE